MIESKFPCRMIIHAYKEEDSWRFELMKHEIWNNELSLEWIINPDNTRLSEYEWVTECFGDVFDINNIEDWTPKGWDPDKELEGVDEAIIETMGSYVLEVDHCCTGWSEDPPEDDWYAYIEVKNFLVGKGKECVDLYCGREELSNVNIEL